MDESAAGAYFHDYTFTANYQKVLVIAYHRRYSSTGGMSEESSQGYRIQSSKNNLTELFSQFKKINSTNGSRWQVITLDNVVSGDTLTMSTKTANYVESTVFILEMN